MKTTANNKDNGFSKVMAKAINISKKMEKMVICGNFYDMLMKEGHKDAANSFMTCVRCQVTLHPTYSDERIFNLIMSSVK